MKDKERDTEKDKTAEKYLAHIAEDGREQTVLEHRQGTARRAGDFAAVFDAAACGYDAGDWHDVGKYGAGFQRRIRGSSEAYDHSTAGARVLWEKKNVAGALAVAGHHGGLPDLGASTDPRSLRGRLAAPPAADLVLPADEVTPPTAEIPAFAWHDPFSLAFFIRMLFSCLTDADFLDTEEFMDGKPAPRGAFPTVETLYQRLLDNEEVKGWLASPAPGVNALRTGILRACLQAGAEDRKSVV